MSLSSVDEHGSFQLNPFFERIQREGMRFPLSKEMVDGVEVLNPYFRQIQASGGAVIKLGRPRKSEARSPTAVKSIRLPEPLWKRLEAKASREGKTRQAALREAVLIWLKS